MSRYLENKKFISQQLKENVRVAVEYEGYETGLPPKQLWDDMSGIGHLVPFKRAMERASAIAHSFGASGKATIGQLQEIEKMVSNFADELAKQAEISETDASAQPAEKHQRIARLFENKHKEKLVINSPDFFIG